MPTQPRCPDGDLNTYERAAFTHDGASYDVYRKGTGPAVLVLTEMPGISPQVLGFADRVVALGCSVTLPDLFGTAGRDPVRGARLTAALYSLRTAMGVCIRREFSVLAAGRSSPVVDWLRVLGAHEHERCGGPGIGVIGMCFTGGFALALATDARVLAPVVSQPSLPFAISESRKHSIDCSDADLERVAGRCAADGLRVLGLRFSGDPIVPRQRFEFLRERLGDGFIAVELKQADGHPADAMRRHHSVLTHALIDEPGQPTRAALDQVLDLFRSKLLAR
jgi:dienelactone hydrolase